MSADPEFVERTLNKYRTEIAGTEAVIANQERDLHDSRKRLDKLNEDKLSFERDVASVGGVTGEPTV